MKNKVVVLMATFNGEKYLIEQIESLKSQKGIDVDILVRDDGSTDNTINILENYQKEGTLTWYAGAHLNVAKGFLDLIKNAPKAKYYAFCDQDDVWDEDKLLIATEHLEKVDNNKPALYYSGLRLVDENLNKIGEHRLNTRRSLLSTFVSSNVAGCTTVFNEALLKKVKYYEPNEIVMHDSWVYKVCVCLGGNVIIDKNPHISYRQHSNNVVGLKKELFYRIKQFNKYINNKSQHQMKSLYEGYNKEMLSEYRYITELICTYDKNFNSWIKLLMNKDIDFKNFNKNFAFRIKVLLKKL